MAKNPAGLCTAPAASMVDAVAAPATGVAKPRARSAPPPASPSPAITALIFGGWKPMASMPPVVPLKPCPPNQPNSFCVP